jgi:hypothetical protein
VLQQPRASLAALLDERISLFLSSTYHNSSANHTTNLSPTKSNKEAADLQQYEEARSTIVSHHKSRKGSHEGSAQMITISEANKPRLSERDMPDPVKEFNQANQVNQIS